MKLQEFTLLKNGEPQCFCWCPPSQVQRFQLVIGHLCKLAVRFGFNYQFESKIIEI